MGLHIVHRADVNLGGASLLERRRHLSAILEGLVPHKNVAIQREAELSPREKGCVALGVLAVCGREGSKRRVQHDARSLMGQAA
jgi:hypothetical protein